MSTRSFVMRCDAAPVIGAGHLVRCVALALALQRQGHVVEFLSRPSRSAEEHLGGLGLQVTWSAETSGGVDDTLSETDADATIALALDRGAGCVLVDHYGADIAYLRALRTAGLAAAVIDDRADRDLRDADWLLNQNLGAPSLPYRTRPDAVLLLGPGYALLRPEFVLRRDRMQRTYGPDDRRVLVTFGGGDTSPYCLETLESLEHIEKPLEVRCVLGFDATQDRGLEALAETSHHAVELLRGVDSMAEQMCWADVSANAGGSTCWELLCLGVPMVVARLDAGETGNAATLPAAGLALAAESPAAVGQAVEALLADPARRRQLSLGGARLVDGAGADRAAVSLAAVAAPVGEVIRADH